jgi:hypothetical protein
MPTTLFGSNKMEGGIGKACRNLGDVTNVYEEENPEGNPKSKRNIIQIDLK